MTITSVVPCICFGNIIINDKITFCAAGRVSFSGIVNKHSEEIWKDFCSPLRQHLANVCRPYPETLGGRHFMRFPIYFCARWSGNKHWDTVAIFLPSVAAQRKRALVLWTFSSDYMGHCNQELVYSGKENIFKFLWTEVKKLATYVRIQANTVKDC